MIVLRLVKSVLVGGLGPVNPDLRLLFDGLSLQTQRVIMRPVPRHGHPGQDRRRHGNGNRDAAVKGIVGGMLGVLRVFDVFFGSVSHVDAILQSRVKLRLTRSQRRRRTSPWGCCPPSPLAPG